MGFTPPPAVNGGFFLLLLANKPKKFHGFIYFHSENESRCGCAARQQLSGRNEFVTRAASIASLMLPTIGWNKGGRSIDPPPPTTPLAAVCRYIRDLLSREICRRFRVILSRCCRCPSCITIQRLKGPGFNPLTLRRVAARVHRYNLSLLIITRDENSPIARATIRQSFDSSLSDQLYFLENVLCCRRIWIVSILFFSGFFFLNWKYKSRPTRN